MRSWSRNGSLRSSSASATVKTATESPMPRARVRTAVAVNPGARRRLLGTTGKLRTRLSMLPLFAGPALNVLQVAVLKPALPQDPLTHAHRNRLDEQRAGLDAGVELAALAAWIHRGGQVPEKLPI